MWGIGNELALGTREREPLWRAVNRVAEMIHEEDPTHPAVPVLAGGGRKLREVAELCPAVDAVGINAYGALRGFASGIEERGWTKPYLVTEFGPRGHWMVPKTPPLAKASSDCTIW